MPSSQPYKKYQEIIKQKTILITGGTGSFGRAFIKKMLQKYEPGSIRIYSRDELKQYNLRKEFNNNRRLRFLIGDVRDMQRLKRASEGVDILIHTAALKQVPSCEYNPIEAIKTNIQGAVNVIESSLDNKIKYVIALSTDKAVNPINLYGATKLCSDKLFVHANSYTGNRGTKFSVVRYGNVLASRGSVIPLFCEQAKNKRITITDERMTRFWISLEAATEFVISCLSMTKGGEIFVPKLPSMKITDLAKAICHGCKIKNIGIRPGEKLDEYLISTEEGRRTLELKDRYIVQPESISYSYKNAILTKDGFNYNSKDNDAWLSIDDMRKIVEKIQIY